MRKSLQPFSFSAAEKFGGYLPRLREQCRGLITCFLIGPSYGGLILVSTLRQGGGSLTPVTICSPQPTWAISQRLLRDLNVFPLSVRNLFITGLSSLSLWPPMGPFLTGNFEQLSTKNALINWYLLHGLQGTLGGLPDPTLAPWLGSTPAGQFQSQPGFPNLWVFASLPSCFLPASQANAYTSDPLKMCISGSIPCFCNRPWELCITSLPKMSGLDDHLPHFAPLPALASGRHSSL